MVEKFLSSVGASFAKAVTAGAACANAVVCHFAKMAVDAHTRYYLMAVAVALLLVMIASFVVVGKNFMQMFHGEAQNGVNIAA